jgi:hypothetical protein
MTKTSISDIIDEKFVNGHVYQGALGKVTSRRRR